MQIKLNQGNLIPGFARKVRKWIEGQPHVILKKKFKLELWDETERLRWCQRCRLFSRTLLLQCCCTLESTDFEKNWHEVEGGGLWGGTPRDSDLIDLGTGLALGFYKSLQEIPMLTPESQSSSLVLPCVVATSPMWHRCLEMQLGQLETGSKPSCRKRKWHC